MEPHPILGETAFEHAVITLTAPSNVERMHCFMHTGLIEPARKRR